MKLAFDILAIAFFVVLVISLLWIALTFNYDEYERYWRDRRH